MTGFLSTIEQKLGIETKDILQNTLHLTNALQIADKSKSLFLQEAQVANITKENAEKIYQIAKEISGQAIFKAMSYKTSASVTNPVKKYSNSEKGRDLSSFIDDKNSYESIFGSLDYYEVDDDNSILSPAAYYTDLYSKINEDIEYTKPSQLQLTDNNIGDGAEAITIGNYFIIVGGVIQNGVSSTMSVYDISDIHLNQPVITKTLKEPRAYFSSAIVNEYVVLVGGDDNQTYEVWNFQDPTKPIFVYQSKQFDIRTKKNMSSTVWKEYVIIFGGEISKTKYSKVVDIIDLSKPKNPTIVNRDLVQLKIPVNKPQVQTLGNKVICAGGQKEDGTSSEKIYIFDFTEPVLDVQEGKLKEARAWFTSTVVNNTVVFAGGTDGSKNLDSIETLALADNGSVQIKMMDINLSEKRNGLTSITNGNIVAFAGGIADKVSATIDLINFIDPNKPTKMSNANIKLKTARDNIAATSVGDYAIFAGGYVKTGDIHNHEIDIIPLNSIPSLDKRRPDLLSMKLDKDNTETEKPYLEICNNILSNYIKESSDKSSNLSNKGFLNVANYLKYYGVRIENLYDLLGYSKNDIDSASLGFISSQEIVDNLKLGDVINQAFNLSDITSTEYNAGVIAQNFKLGNIEEKLRIDQLNNIASIKQVQEKLNIPLVDLDTFLKKINERYSILSKALNITSNELKCWEQILDIHIPALPNCAVVNNLIDNILWAKISNLSAYQIYFIINGSFFNDLDNQHFVKVIESLNKVKLHNNFKDFTELLSHVTQVDKNTIDVFLQVYCSDVANIEDISTKKFSADDITSIFRSLYTINALSFKHDEIKNIVNNKDYFGTNKKFNWHHISLTDIKRLTQVNILKQHAAQDPTIDISIPVKENNFSHILGYKDSDIKNLIDNIPVNIPKLELNLTKGRFQLSSTTIGNYAIFAGGQNNSESAVKTIDILDMSYPGNPKKVNVPDSSLLSTERTRLSAASVGNYVIFAGGYNSDDKELDIIDILDMSNPSTPKMLEIDHSKIKLTKKRSDLTATSIGNYVIFAGGYNSDDKELDTIDILDMSYPSTPKMLEIDHSKIKLTKKRSDLTATNIGNYVIFAGGYNSDDKELDIIDILDMSNPSTPKMLEIDHSTVKLSKPRDWISATSIGNYAIFAGGYNSDDKELDRIDILDMNDSSAPKMLEIDHSNIKMSSRRSLVAITSIGNYAIFAGGYNSTDKELDTIDILDMNDSSTPKMLEIDHSKIKLPKERRDLTATSIGNYAIFAGGRNSSDEKLSAMDIIDFSSLIDTNSISNIELLSNVKFESLFKLYETYSVINSIGINTTNFVNDILLKLKDDNTNYNDISDKLKQYITNKISDKNHTSVIYKIQEPVLEKERNYLASIILNELSQKYPNAGITTLDDLYEYLLIDTKTSGSVLISPLKQGLNSLQLYIQRVLIGLEPYTTSSLQNEEWSWILSYRMWQANREVFLYPENYFNPSLRKEASPEYQHFTKAISQGDITDENVDKAYSSYLKEFETLSGLEIVNYCYANVTSNADKGNATNALYVIGRTKTQPYQYYNRIATLNTSGGVQNWKPWEKITAHIPTESVSSVYAFNRWFIFWLEFTTETHNDNNERLSEKQTKESYATIKYIYLTPNNQWSPPQTLLEKTKYADNGKLNVGELGILGDLKKNPQLSIEFSHENDEIIISMLALRTIVLSKDFTKTIGKPASVRIKQSDFQLPQDPNVYQSAITLNNHMISVRESKFIDIMDYSDIENPKLLNTNLELQVKREHIALATVGNYVVFAGGLDGDAAKQEIDVLDCSDMSQPKLLASLKLSTPRGKMVAQTVGNYVVLAGGVKVQNPSWDGDYLKNIDILDFSKATPTNINYHEQLSEAASNQAITAIGKYIVLVGGKGPKFTHTTIDVIDMSAGDKPKVIRKRMDAKLARHSMSAVTVGERAIFAGGYAENHVANDRVFVIKMQNGAPIFSVLEKSLSVGRANMAATALQNRAIFAGGDINGSSTAAFDIISFVDEEYPTIKHGNLSEERSDIQIINDNRSAFFIGGKSHATESRKVDKFSLELSKEPLSGTYIQNDIDSSTIKDLMNVYMGEGSTGLFNQYSNILYPQDSSNHSFSEYYSNYLWELFFHIPAFIANKLSQNQKFEEAKKWYEYIFNPISHGSANHQYWNFTPFKLLHLQSLETQLSDPAEVAIYEKDPYDPEAIAMLRPGAFEKFVVMKYIDNLINWGDYLFTQYSWENISHARMLYVMAYNLLGPKPQAVRTTNTSTKTINDLISSFPGGIPEWLVKIENTLPNHQTFTTPAIFNNISIIEYFGIPVNEQLIAYWTRIEDRLYKIRHNENIRGQNQSLPLFQPPIDPNTLVSEAAEAALYGNLGSPRSINDVDPTMLLGRFKVAINQAHSTVNTVIEFGNAIEAAYEKKDSEHLQVLAETQSQTLLNLITDIKNNEINQAQQNIDALTENLNSAQYRENHYRNLMSAGLSSLERHDITLSTTATALQEGTAGLRLAAVPLHLVPTVFGFSDGDFQPGSSLDSGAMALDSVAGVLNGTAATINKFGSYERRMEEWQLSQQTAEYEKQQIQKQIDSNNTALTIAQQNLINHKTQISQAQEKLSFYKSKFSNEQLYEWIYEQLLSVYGTAYDLAFNTYLAAVRSYEFELNQEYTQRAKSQFFESRKGLLSGQLLKLSINQLEQNYYYKYNNYYKCREIEKTISLRELLEHYKKEIRDGEEFTVNAMTFEQGLHNGSWTFTLPQSLFDKDFNGHTCRRIKTIAISFPSIIGPYENIAATLQQTSHSIYGLLGATPSTRSDNPVPYTNWISKRQICLSRNISDHGMFELNFHSDDYLPFEYTGAVSDWCLTIHNSTTSGEEGKIDISQLSDIIIKLLYTSEENKKEIDYPGSNPQ